MSNDYSDAYAKALEEYNKAWEVWDKARSDYRSNRIDDDAYLKARKAFDGALYKVDQAADKERDNA